MPVCSWKQWQRLQPHEWLAQRLLQRTMAESTESCCVLSSARVRATKREKQLCSSHRRCNGLPLFVRLVPAIGLERHKHRPVKPARTVTHNRACVVIGKAWARVWPPCAACRVAVCNQRRRRHAEPRGARRARRDRTRGPATAPSDRLRLYSLSYTGPVGKIAGAGVAACPRQQEHMQHRSNDNQCKRDFCRRSRLTRRTMARIRIFRDIDQT